MSESEQRKHDLAILGQALRMMREQRDLSRSELSVSSGVSQQSIAMVEDGRLDPTYELLLALSRGMRVQPSALILCTEDIRARAARDRA